MKETLATTLRHMLTFLAGLGGFLAARGAIDPADAAALNVSGATIQDALAGIGAALIMRLFIFLTQKISGDIGAKAGGSSLLLVLGMAAGIMCLSLPSCGVSYNGTGKPTFYLDPVALAKLVQDWQRSNDAKDANVIIMPSPAGQTIVATKPNGETITEVINPSGVIVKP